MARRAGVARGIRGVAGAILLLGLFSGGEARAQPEQVGQWSTRYLLPMSLTHSILLPTGKVYIFGEFEQGLERPMIFDPATNVFGRVAETPPFNIFCAGHSFLEDGTLLLTGGHVDSHIGEPYSLTLDPHTLALTPRADMNDRRWYPTNTTIGTGEVAVFSGETHAAGTSNSLVQMYQPETGTWRDLTGAVRSIPYYPRTFLAPNGRILMCSPYVRTMWLDTAGAGTWIESVKRGGVGLSYGSAALWNNRVILFGGGDPPTADVEVLDLDGPMDAWSMVRPMRVARRQLNSTLLPDGRVLITGGTSAEGFDNRDKPALDVDVYDPASDTWARWGKLPANASYRGYHATSLLLPDGRVLVGGGRHALDAHVYSPPYLFRGPRPTVTGGVPGHALPGDRFVVQTPDGARVSKVTLLSPGAVTHAFDQNVRFRELSFTRRAGGLEVTLPESNNLAPPGPYMLFLVADDGTPSVASWLSIRRKDDPWTKQIILADTWRYLDNGTDPGSAWTQPSFNDAAWSSGAGQLGYGEGDESTVLDDSPIRPSYYFRRRVTLASVPEAARIEVLHDDGVAVWINGTLAYQNGVTKGLAHKEYASASHDNTLSTFAVDPSLLRAGENVIAVMVKQLNATSNDLSFALQLETLGGTPPPTDGGTPDAGTPDAGVPDAGVPDAGVPDAGEPDAGVPDAGVPDAGVPDAGEPDGGTGTAVRAIPFGSEWRWEASNVAPPADWAEPGFDDRAWPRGPAQLGYGDGDEATVLPRTSPSQSSVYFRRQLVLDRPVDAAVLHVLFDDGFAVFVNGTQVMARNVERGLDHSKTASGSAENEEASETLTLSPNPFVVGANTLAVVVKQVGPTSPDLSFDLALDLVLRGEAPPDTGEPDPGAGGPVEVIPRGSIWKYEARGIAPPADWNLPGFDDRSWASGAGELGYGDGDETTVLPRTVPSQTSVYFRREFQLDGPVTAATLGVLFDDGFAAWVNGVLVMSRNVDRGLEHARTASASTENEEVSGRLSLSPNPFVVGRNTIAVIVKQVGPTSPDLSFDLWLEVTPQ